MDNKTVETTLLEIARILDLKGENPFKVRAYENAARAIASLEEDVATLIKEERLKHIPGIGSSIREKLLELCATGTLTYLEEIRAGIPPGVFDMMKIQGLGPKKTKALWEQLAITSLEELEKACRDDRIAGLKGFGKKTQEKILSGLSLFARTRDRVLRAEALPIATRLADALRAVPNVKRVEIAGSLRRGRETVRDVDILVGCAEAEPVMKAFVAHPDVADVIGSGPTKTSVHTAGGLQVDVRVVPPDSFACALAYFTGSKEFNVHLRQLALDQGYTLNEYSLRPLDGTPAPALATEADLFAKLGLSYVEPELRENTGEVDLARASALPTLVAPADLQGVLHVHTTWSDGVGSVEDMVAEAEQLGYHYIGISDHSQAAHYANGLTPERLRAQRAEVEAARAAHPKVVVLHGIECDIMGDGSLDLPDDCLASLDFVIASVHTELGMERERMTARLVRAVSHPAVRVLGHPLGRRLLERESSQFDWEPVLEAAKKNDVAIEVNGQPQRLDADWIHIRRVRAKGVKLCINPDAHAPGTLDDARRHALVEARRGWTTKADVVNALPAERFVAEFLRRPAVGAAPPAVVAALPPPAPASAVKKKATKKKAAT
jgi:DNA polymerase (family 10)